MNEEQNIEVPILLNVEVIIYNNTISLSLS